MPPGIKPRFTIIGAGLSGALMATYLGRAGYQVDVYERRPDPRGGKVLAGRSVSVPIATRGLYALRQVGVAERVLQTAVPIAGRAIHRPGGGVWFHPYGSNEKDVVYSVSAVAVNIALLDAAQRCLNVEVRFDRKCVDVDLDRARAELVNTVTRQPEASDGDILIGADGIHSVVRQRMQRLDRFNYAQEYLDFGYKELSIPRGADGRAVLQPNALHIWPRRSFVMIALPSFNESFSCSLFGPLYGRDSLAAIRTDDEIVELFRERFPDAVPVMPALVEDFRRSATGSLVTIRCSPWFYRDKLVLVGDACHAVLPFYGQAVDAALEDCMVLSECMVKHAANWERVFAEYHAARKQDVDALAVLSAAAFANLRDRMSWRRFGAKRRAERMLHRLAPRWFVPLHTLIAFTRTPYAEAVRRARRQRRMIGFSAAVALALLLLLTALLAR